jgi:hypothetical protein
VFFYLKIHQNNIYFYFLKIIFDINISKRLKNIKKNNQNCFSNYLEMLLGMQFQTSSARQRIVILDYIAY